MLPCTVRASITLADSSTKKDMSQESCIARFRRARHFRQPQDDVDLSLIAG